MVTNAPDARPDLACGERFRIKSRRGTDYVVTFLHRERNGDGMYVRLSDRRIARLNDDRVRWSTYARVSQEGEPLVAPGDQILVEMPSRSIRGKLAEEIVGDEIVIRRPSGRVIRVPRAMVVAFSLLFPAQNLTVGDRFMVQSKSGNQYRGVVTALPGRDRATVTLDDGREMKLRLERVDFRTLFVPVPVPLHEL